MAKSRPSSIRLNNGQRSHNVCVSSSSTFSSSEEERDMDTADDRRKGQKSIKRVAPSRNSRSRTSFSKVGDNSMGRSNQLGLNLADNGVGKPFRYRFDQTKGTQSGTFKRKWNNEQEDDSDRMQSKCFSRNAVMARLNRIKKKNYVESLERNVSTLTEENDALKGTVDRQKESVKGLKNRVRYLESVLANSHEISMLLKNIQNATGLPTINSLQQKNIEQNIACEQSKSVPEGFPPPQPDHIYSMTPCVEFVDEDKLCSVAESPFIAESMTIQEDTPLSWLSNDTSLPFMSPDSLIDMNLLSPNSDDMFNLDVPEFHEQLIDNDKLLSDVGICLHIAKKRVSLEFCATCNNNAMHAWDEGTLDTSME